MPRALAYRTRAIELAQQAKREDDPSQRRFLVDKARALVNVADALDPQPASRAANFLQQTEAEKRLGSATGSICIA
jgi:hypothetical protein